MRNILLSFISVCFVLIANSQTSNTYIQVVAEDTIEVAPEEIIYNVYIASYSEYTDITKSSKSPSGKSAPVNNDVAKLSAMIKRMDIDTIPVNNYIIQSEIYRSPIKSSPKAAYSLRFTSKEKLRSFISEASQIEGLAGYIALLKSSKEQEAKNILTERLLAKAKTEAAYIARQSNRTLGELISVQEESIEKSSGGWTMYPPLSAIAESYFSDALIRDKIIVSRRLVVRFLW